MSKKKSTTNSAHSGRRPWYKHSGLLKCLLVVCVCFIAWLIYLDAQVRYKFEGKRWALPAQVYARALEIYDGRALNIQNLKQELTLLNYRKVARVNSAGEYSIQGTNIHIIARAHDLPGVKHSSANFQFSIQGDVVHNLVSLDQSEQHLYSLEPFKIGGIYPVVKEERILVKVEELPKELIAALLVTEDKDYYHHFGVSPFSILRAMWVNLRAGQVVQGGSTLTQQLVKNFYLSRERSISRKLNEAFMSLLLEAHYDKNAILETYLNDIYLGQSGATAIHGFGMASQFYFGKALEYCDLQEFALLVAMVKGPSYYDPRRFPERALERRNLVLSLLRDEGVITGVHYHEVASRPLGVVLKPTFQSNRYPGFMDLVKRQLRRDYNEEDLRTEGLKIYTTLDPQVQHRVEQSIAKLVPVLAQQKGSPELQAGSVVTGVGTGEVVALVGDKNIRYNGFNRALDAVRPVGSLIKPAVFLSALEQPDDYHLASLLSDKAFRIEFQDGQVWEPSNFDNKSHEDVLFYRALANSYNLAAARLGLDIGVESVHETLKKLGYDKDINPYPSLFLGAQSLSPFEVSKLYQTIASNGFNMPLRAIREVTDMHNQSLSRYPFKIKQVFAPEAVYLLQHALKEVMRTGTGRSVYQHLPENLRVAGKTGTTNDNRDSWFAGFSGDYLGVVWLGLDDNGPTKLTGSTGALTIWTDFIKRIPQHSLSMIKPAAITPHWFDTKTGVRTDENCRGAQAVPIWGEVDKITYQRCDRGFSTLGGWLKSWF
jgi:penicillin-binding protein 1B